MKQFVIFFIFLILVFSMNANVVYHGIGTHEVVSYPGNFPSFLFGFLITLPLAYTLYFAGLGFLTVLVVYLGTKGNKQETKKVFWGFLAGLVLGIGIRLIVMYSMSG